MAAGLRVPINICRVFVGNLGTPSKTEDADSRLRNILQVIRIWKSPRVMMISAFTYLRKSLVVRL